MTEQEIKLEEAARAVLLQMFFPIEDDDERERFLDAHKDQDTAQWQRAKQYAKAALGYAMPSRFGI